MHSSSPTGGITLKISHFERLDFVDAPTTTANGKQELNPEMGDRIPTWTLRTAFKASSSVSRSLPTLRTQPIGDHPAGREQGTLRQLNPGSIRVGFGAFGENKIQKPS